VGRTLRFQGNEVLKYLSKRRTEKGKVEWA
jgi:hypothetical protein